MKKKVFFTVIYVLAFLTAVINTVFTVKESLFADINDLPVGRLIESVQSPDEDMTLNVYFVENSLGTGIRGEIVRGDSKENVFWQTGIEEVECGWHNDKIVVIDHLYLDVARGDTFDCRRDVSILQNHGLAGDEKESQTNTDTSY